jgi:hypothetical protein
MSIISMTLMYKRDFKDSQRVSDQTFLVNQPRQFGAEVHISETSGDEK